MAEYIEREEIMNRLFTEYATDSKADVFELIRSIPAADVRPIKHGRWSPSGRDNDYNSYCRCSECGSEIVMYQDSEKKPPNYCDNCGARMDLKGGDTK